MVGAGFSRNAKAISAGVPPLALWSDVTRRFCAELRGKVPQFGDDPTRLAQEYEDTFSRDVLDALLLEAIPDSQYEPGLVHQLLVCLPWTDIFTTNYDTLLERTQPEDPAVQYQLILTPSDIVSRPRPRIVKLHGSFPSQRPFIITSEDYRTYPRLFAPFVNMVQQAVMENVFCLLGFSGEDANFLAWAGWVRDHLESSAPMIYLVGAHDLDSTKRRYFEKLRVLPVDLGPLFPRRDWPAEIRQSRAAEWFLRTLHVGRPPTMLRWPSSPDPKPVPPSSDFLPDPLNRISRVVFIPPPERSSAADVDAEWLNELVKSWRSQRIAYPGWVVCPELNRKSLWIDSIRTLDLLNNYEALKKVTDQLEPPARIVALREIVWRFDRCLLPLTPCLAKLLPEVIAAVNPSPAHISLAGAAITPDSPRTASLPALDWNEIREAWAELVFAMLRDAWHEMDATSFAQWDHLLADLVKLKPDWEARIGFERSWFAMLRLDEVGTNRAVQSWRSNTGEPFWEAKRAALMSENGRAADAVVLAKACLQRIRQPGVSGLGDYRRASAEGWIVELLRLLEQSESDNGNSKAEHSERLAELQRFRCDPGDDRMQRNADLRNTKLGFQHRKVAGFDPGRISRSTQIVSSNGEEWIVLQTVHDGAVPVRCGSMTVDADSLTAASGLLWRNHPLLATAVLLRIGDTRKKLEELLSRRNVSAMKQELVERMFDWLSDRLDESLQHGVDQGNGLRRRVLDNAPQVLSRLTVRLDEARLDRCFDFAVTMYQSLLYRNDLGRYDLVDSMFERTLFAASLEQRSRWIPRLLALGIPGSDGFEVGEPEFWREPTNHALVYAKERGPKSVALSTDVVAKLIRIVREGERESRTRASVRLAVLAVRDELSPEERSSFASALWSRPSNSGLPAETGLHLWALLEMPEPSIGKAKEVLKAHFLSGAIPHPRGGGDPATALSSLEMQHCCNHFSSMHQATATLWSRPGINPIDWTEPEATALFEKIAEWWKQERDVLARQRSHHRTLETQAGQLVAAMTRVVFECLLPRIKNEAVTTTIRAFATSVVDAGYRIVDDLPTLVGVGLETESTALVAIRAALLSALEDEVFEGVRAACSWVALFPTGDGTRILLTDLSALIEARRWPGLGAVVQQMTVIVEKFPDLLTDNDIGRMSRGLASLADETKTVEDAQRDDLMWPPEERVLLRGHASSLAARLVTACERKKLDQPAALAIWKAIGAVDALPEVRRSWENGEQQGGD